MSGKSLAQYVDGFPLPSSFSADSFRSALTYKPRPDDIFLVTYPKCGTTWTGQILLLLLQKGEPLKKPSDLHAKAPFLELTGAKAAENMPRPGPIKSHLPFHLAPWSKDSKYIYVARNPKDCCVSYYHHVKNLPGHGFEGTFDQFFELFMVGDIYWGDYFDHLQSWYSHRNDPNVFFVTYEELKEDIDSAILKMAAFIDDKEYAEPIRKDPSLMENIKKYSSLKEMKEFMTKSFMDIGEMTPEELKKSSVPDTIKEILVKEKVAMKAAIEGKKSGPNISNFVRKGIVGDWKNYFSEEQSRRLEEKFLEKTKDMDIPNIWLKNMEMI
ncbi:sulfotransferase 1 family member D1-like isoform X1 [Parasteatoda tepidariorum]|uniref:sulfotransferase 1 family member D1-like isoform X1 n=1 Tax=Parasteatoda tepidariorum TaxID=114398 RepID=UPI001C7254BD|nr:sulfotransferase 1 family member D1-like [Parasteatoda tepidariorum]